jgi:hypothetical protein
MSLVPEYKPAEELHKRKTYKFILTPEDISVIYHHAPILVLVLKIGYLRLLFNLHIRSSRKRITCLGSGAGTNDSICCDYPPE